MRTETRSPQLRPGHPALPHTLDPERMHPRAVEMAQRMREGATTFRELVAAGFTSAEITELHAEAADHAKTLSTTQLSPGADLLREMVAKARAAIANQMPMPKGATETQALVLAWNRYCTAHAAHVLDPWSGQRERCLALLFAFFRLTPLGEAQTGHVVRAVAETLETRH